MTDKQLEELEENEEVITEENEEEVLDDKDKEIEKWKGRYKSMMKKKQEEGDDDRDVDTIVEEKLAKREVNSRVEAVIEQIPEKYREKFQEEFKDLSEGRSLTLDNVEKYIKSALAISVPSDEENLDAIKAGAMVNTPRSSKQGFKKKEDPNVAYSNKLLRGAGVLN